MIYAAGIPTNLFVECICENSNYRDLFLTFFCHICKVQPGVFIVNSTVKLRLIHQRKKSASLSFIKAFWQLSLQRNHIFPREQGTGGRTCHTCTMPDQDCLSVWVSRHRGACNSNRFVIFINQPVSLKELDCLCVTAFTGNDSRQNSFCLWSLWLKKAALLIC